MLRPLLLAVASMQIASFASVSFDINAERLDDADGFPMPDNGLVIFVVDRNGDGFLDPNTTWFTREDDLILEAWQIGNPFGPGTFEPLTFSEDIGNGVNPGDPVKLLWFPTMTSTNSPPNLGAKFGEYEGDPVWTVPSDGSSASLSFLTFDAGGTDPLITGDATLTVVPEPATYAAAFALGCLGWALAKRRNEQVNTKSSKLA